MIQRLHLRESPKALLATVTAAADAGSDLITVTARSPSAVGAATVANAYVQQYINVSTAQLRAQAGTAITQLRSQLKALRTITANQQERQSLQASISQLQALEASAATQRNQPNPAVPSSVPFAPTPKRDALFALVIALGLGLALVFTLERFDRRIRSVDEVSEVYGVPLLAVIPHVAATIDVTSGDVVIPAPMREPFRSLRGNLKLAALEAPVNCVVVASAVAGEGKSTVVRNLALTYRESGVSVVIVEADLRRPTLSAIFAVTPGAGLTGVLVGACNLDDALMDIAFDTTSVDYLDKVGADSGPTSLRGTSTSSASAKRLALLPSGAAPPDPQAVLGSDKTRQVVEELSERFDVVLIDTPPLLAVSDAIPLLFRSDGILLVTRVGKTERRAAQKAAEAVRRDPRVRLLGVVANDVAVGPGSGYGYGYGYGYAETRA